MDGVISILGVKNLRDRGKDLSLSSLNGNQDCSAVKWSCFP